MSSYFTAYPQPKADGPLAQAMSAMLIIISQIHGRTS